MQTRESFEKSRKQNFPFQTRKRSAETVVDAGTEGQRRSLAARKVKSIWVGEPDGVAIGGPEEEKNYCARVDADVTYLGLL
jgi:hypothetical protein